MKLPKPVVAIIGRPNVGKSTLFNRLVASRVAIVDGEPGVTRDRLYAEVEWKGRGFFLVDTGGLVFGEEEEVQALVRRQVEVAIREADLVLLVVDGRQGVMPVDQDIAMVLREHGKSCMLVVNKIDNPELEGRVAEFYELGLGDPFPVSAAHGRNIGDLLDAIVAAVPEVGAPEQEAMAIKVALLGRPNVGKSSLVNRLLGEERVVVDTRPGTTRDAVDTLLEREGKRYLLIDTAGLKRKARKSSSIEYYSMARSIRALKRCDVALLVLDAKEGVTSQDKRIAGRISDEGKAVVIVVNKWDLIPKGADTARVYEEAIRSALYFIDYAPIVFVSALTGLRVCRILEVVEAVAAEGVRRVPTPALNRVIEDAALLSPPPAAGPRRRSGIFYATQVGVKPPTFVLFADEPRVIPEHYDRYLERRLREAFGFAGNPVRIYWRRKKPMKFT